MKSTDYCIVLLVYSLLVELTVPPSCSSAMGAELFHASAEEAYESAVHSVHSADGHRAIWREYILYVRSRGIRTAQHFRTLLNCVQRCVMNVPWTRPLPRPCGGGGPNGSQDEAVAEDYYFHNEVGVARGSGHL